MVGSRQFRGVVHLLDIFNQLLVGGEVVGVDKGGGVEEFGDFAVPRIDRDGAGDEGGQDFGSYIFHSVGVLSGG